MSDLIKRLWLKNWRVKMSDDQVSKTPLQELLRKVPTDFRAEWPIQWSEDGLETGHALSQTGHICHEAADRIEELEKEVQEWKAKFEWAADKLRRVADVEVPSDNRKVD